MFSCPSPIQTDSFDTVWSYTVKKRGHAKKMALVRRVAVPIAQILFFLAFFVLSYGTVYTLSGTYIRSYFDQVPALPALWEQFRGLVFSSAGSRGAEILRCLGLVYLLPLAATVPFALLIFLLYHPKTPKLPEDEPQRARDLWVAARHAHIFSRQKVSSTGTFCSVFYGVIALAAAVGFILYGMSISGYTHQIEVSAAKISFYVCVGAVGLVVCYLIANIPLRLILKYLYATYLPKNLLSETEAYYRSHQVPTPGQAQTPLEEASCQNPITKN